MAGPVADARGEQAEVMAFLSDPAAWPDRPQHVERVETHANIVFLAGAEALKIKRAVRLAYLDFSTLAAREAVCRREIALNRPNAPGIYLGVVAVTREADGRLAIGGEGVPVEWAVRMARFQEADVLARIAARQSIGDDLARSLADMLRRAHAGADRREGADTVGDLRRLIAELDGSLAAPGPEAAVLDDLRRRFVAAAGAQLARAAPVLERRAAAGCVRRCHGDLHLGNIVLWQGRPVPFDALEFDERLATIDVLYDLAFLLMDLDRRGQRGAAHIVLDRYLAGLGRDLDLEGLAALPLFLGLRAGIRAMVALDRARNESGPQRSATIAHAVETLALALGYLAPPPPRLVAVGGLSGSGKSTLSAGLAPLLAPVPGALHLRSDVIRKELAGTDALARLPAEAYTPEAACQVYAEMARRARLALAAGHSALADAVSARPQERAALEAVAREAGVRFDGLWLEAAADVLRSRVAARLGDASDATTDVVDRQLLTETGAIGWMRIAATSDPAAVLAAAAAAIGVPLPAGTP